MGASTPCSTSCLLTCTPKSSRRRMTSPRRGGARGRPPPGRGGGGPGGGLSGRWVSEVPLFVRRPLGWRPRWRLAVGMPGLLAAPEQGPPEPSAPRPRTGFVLGLDVGSSVIRCHVYDRAGRVRGSSAQKVTGNGRRAAVRVAKANGRRCVSLRPGGRRQPGPGSRGARAGLCGPGQQAAARAPSRPAEARAPAPRARGSPHLGVRRSGLTGGPRGWGWPGAWSLGFPALP